MTGMLSALLDTSGYTVYLVSILYATIIHQNNLCHKRKTMAHTRFSMDTYSTESRLNIMQMNLYAPPVTKTKLYRKCAHIETVQFTELTGISELPACTFTLTYNIVFFSKYIFVHYHVFTAECSATNLKLFI